MNIEIVEDPFVRRLRSLSQGASTLAFIETKSGRVYIAIVLSFTTDPNEAQRVIEVAPVLTGRRHANDNKLHITTGYQEQKVAASESGRISHLLPFSEVTSIGELNFELFRRQVDAENIIMEVSTMVDPPKSQSPL